MKRVVIIGGGNLAESLALAVSEANGVELTQIYLRNAERGAELSSLTGAPYATFCDKIADADIYILAVSDPAIAPLSKELDLPAGAIIAHTAGSTSIEALDNSRLSRAVFYPMQTFSKGRRVVFSEIPIFIEAQDEQTLQEVRALAELLSRSVIELDSEARRRLHLSAVFVCNFVNAMFMAGEELVGESGLDFDVLKPLIAESSAKALAARSPRDLQTGPAVRGDFATMDRHAAMLENNEELKEIYKNISTYIWETLKKI